MTKHLLEVKHISKHFAVQSGLMQAATRHVKAVNDVSFYVDEGQTLGIVGESGCGKSTTGHMVMRIMPPSSGTIHFEGEDITNVWGRALRNLRPHFQMVFQDPYASLNPRFTIQKTIQEPMLVHRLITRRQAADKVAELLEMVGLKADARNRYPHEFSGGQRQRIGIARALALNPKLIVADEAVSALDVSIQSQILNLLIELRKKLGISYIFISHNLPVVRYISDRVAVMYLGQIVELADKEELYHNPMHPYTESLLSAVLEPKLESGRERIILQGDVPNPANPPTGCPFHTRCFKAMNVCKETNPALKEYAGGHQVACHLH